MLGWGIKLDMGSQSWVTPGTGGHLGGREVHDLRRLEGGFSREVSHPLRDRSGLTNAWVEGGVVGALARHGSSGGWLFLAGSSSSTLIPLFTRSLFPYSPDVFPSWKSKRLYFSSFPTPHWRTCIPLGGTRRVEVGGPAAKDWVIIPFFEACGFLVWKKKWG